MLSFDGWRFGVSGIGWRGVSWSFYGWFWRGDRHAEWQCVAYETEPDWGSVLPMLQTIGILLLRRLGVLL